MFGKEEELAQQIRISISEACEKGYERKDLIFLIQLLIKDFSPIKSSPFRLAIDNVITFESAKYGHINLSAVSWRKSGRRFNDEPVSRAPWAPGQGVAREQL